MAALEGQVALQDALAETLPSLPPPQLYAALFNDAPVIHYAATLSGGAPLLFVSPNAASRIGSGADFATGRPWADLIHSDDRRRYAETLEELPRQGGVEIEYRLRAPGGFVWVRDTLRALDAARFVGAAVDISREKQADAQFQDAFGMLSAMVRSALDAVVTIDAEGDVLEFNPEAERMFGYRRDEVIGHSLVALIVPPAHRGGHLAGMRRFIESGSNELPNRRFQVQAQRKDGSTFPVELTIIRTTLGDRSVFVGEIRDISQRVEAEAERDRSIRLLRDAVDNLPAGFTITGPDDRIVICNEAYARSMGKPVEALIGRRRTELIVNALPTLRSVDGEPFDGSPEDIARVTERLCRPGDRPIELETLSGQTMMIGSSQLPDGSVVCVRTDVTEIRRAERAVRESAEVIRQVLESCPVAIKMARLSDGRIIYQSPASRQLYCDSDGECPTYAQDAFVDPADCARLVEEIHAQGEVDGFEVTLRRADGVRFPAAISARLVDVHGELMVVGCTLDLTERLAVEEKLAEQREALHQSEKLAALGELLAGVAHELNNPLSVVVGQALLLKETTDDPKIDDRLDRIGRAADRCVRIVKTFLSMARRRPRRAERVDLNALVREAVEVTAHALRSSGVGLQLHLSLTLPPIEADPDQLVQVMTNLLFNAEIALREATRERRLMISTGIEGNGTEVSIIVRDNGPGVPEELRKRVFEPFFTTRGVGAGTGIGLAFCHRVIEAHGGSIRLDNAPDGGAMFTVILPLKAMDAAAIQADAPALPATPQRRVLVIDDECDVADVLAAMLRQQGDAVDIALSGGAALSQLRQASYDVVLSDLRMPGLDGEKLFQLLSAEQPTLASRLGFITGDAMGSNAQRFLARSGRPYLEKPIAPADLSKLVAEIAGTTGPASP